MKTVEELSRDLVNYYKDDNLYNFTDFFYGEEIAYKNFHRLLSKSGKGLIGEMVEELNMLATENDLTDKKMLDQFDRCCSLIKDLNLFVRSKEKEQEL